MQKEAAQPEQETPKRGRPSDYTQELADRICEQLAMGKSVRTVCKQEDMPAMSTVFKWLRENDDFSEQYARAKEESADVLAEEILDIADDGQNDTYIDDKGNVKTDHDVIARSRLRVDARKWIAAKLKPKKYGDKIDVTSGDEPIKQAATTAEIVATVQQILAAGDEHEIEQETDQSDTSSGQ